VSKFKKNPEFKKKFLRYNSTFLKILIIGISLNLINSCKNSDTEKDKIWNTVHNNVENVRLTFVEFNSNLKSIYNNLTVKKKQENLKKLNKIKTLENELKTKTNYSLKMLKAQVKTDDTLKIISIGIKYLNSIKEVESHFPELNEKTENDINGNYTQKRENIIKTTQNMISIGYEYKKTMREY
tara:strand:+ start:310 stop:858 length:549 start_codon:yes stop_codon:yes gene_type:complete